MKNNSDVKIQTNKLIVSYLLYAISICLIDYIIYIFRLDYLVAVVLGGGIVAIISIVYFRINRAEWLSVPVNVYDAVIVLVIVFFCVIRAIMPDTSYDVRNYHLYYQKFFDRDFISYDFFPMRAVNAQTFGALGDRLFYGFRYFLGYRMGTLLNTLVILIIYFQVKQIFCMLWEEFGHDCKSRWSKILISGGTFICLMTETMYANLSTYMVDYLAVPFLLEIFRVVICENKRNANEVNVTHTAAYLCILSGLAIGIKLTNLLIIFPVALVFLFKYRKKINIKIIFCSLVLLLYPFALYLIISYKLTGNPIFPYLNGVFESPFFSVEKSPNDFSGFSSKFGPVKIYEYLFWPYYMLKFPQRVSEFGTCSGRLLILFVTYIIASFSDFKHFTCKVKYFYMYTIYCYLLFLITFNGYMRYIPILEMIGSVFAIVLLTEWIYNRGNILKILGVLGIHFMLIQIGTANNNYINKNQEWSWRDIKNSQRIAANLPYIFHDYDSGIDDSILSDIDCFVVAEASGALSSELKEDVPIIGIYPYFATTNTETEQLLEERLQEIKGLNIYSLITRDNWLDNLALYNETGLALEDIITIQPNFYDKLYCISLIKLKSVDNKVLNCEFFSSSDEIFTISVADDVDYMDFFVGDSKAEPKTTDNEYHLAVIGRNSVTGYEYIIFDDAVITQTGRYLKYSIDMSECNFDEIEIKKISNESEEDVKETYQIVLQEYKIISEYNLGEELSFFGEMPNANEYYTYGFSTSEEKFTWTNGKEAEMEFMVKGEYDDLILDMSYLTYGDEQRVIVYANENKVEEYVAKGEETKQMIIPSEYIYDDKLVLRFELPDASSPKDNGTGEDVRKLALAMKRLTLLTVK